MRIDDNTQLRIGDLVSHISSPGRMWLVLTAPNTKNYDYVQAIIFDSDGSTIIVDQCDLKGCDIVARVKYENL